MITAKKKDKTVYPDIKMGVEYEVEDARVHIYLKGSKRHYRAIHFCLYKNGEQITLKQAKNYFTEEGYRK